MLFPICVDNTLTPDSSSEILFSNLTFSELSPTNKTDLCEGTLFLGRSNEHIEGHDNILESLAGFYKVMNEINTPSLQSPSSTRILQDISTLMVSVLSNGENQAVDLGQMDNRVSTRLVINTNFLGVASGLLLTIGTGIMALVIGIFL